MCSSALYGILLIHSPLDICIPIFARDQASRCYEREDKTQTWPCHDGVLVSKVNNSEHSVDSVPAVEWDNGKNLKEEYVMEGSSQVGEVKDISSVGNPLPFDFP